MIRIVQPDLRLLSLALVFSACLTARSQTTLSSPEFGTAVTEPCDFDGVLTGTQGLFVVPENRSAKQSRAITIHFFHFPARESPALAPVFLLPGGPGSAINENDLRQGVKRSGHYNTYSELVAFNRNHDVVIVNQRGNGQSPGLRGLPRFWYAKGGRTSQPLSMDEVSTRLQEGLQGVLDACESRGIDAAGYDIINLVHDIDDLRDSLGYDKIALRGGSFGSQWALAYMKRWPERVDRAILSGVEPLDHAYDSAEGVWRVFERLDQQLENAGNTDVAKTGVCAGVKAVVERLEQKAVAFRGRHPRRNQYGMIRMGVEDFRGYLRQPLHGTRPHSRQSLSLLPKFIDELVREDYRYLAAKIIDDKPEPFSESLLLTLCDNSLGISGEREALLSREPARRWLGDLNWRYIATRDLVPTPVVADTFRQPTTCPIPILMIHGDLDLATPIENAAGLLEHLPNGHLIRVSGGTHGATYHAAQADPKFMSYLTLFMDASDLHSNPHSVYEQVPKTIRMPPLEFVSLEGDSMFERLVPEE